ncbi:protease inhibitor I42 family protein [Desulfobulbus sp. TB]|nr:protease inhibitor I42 family protein [Desulfobulbus sp. TB]
MSLCSNATTGYRWSEQENISDIEAIKQVDHNYIAPPCDGGRRKRGRTFKAMKKGQNSVYLEYGQPWEGGEKAERKFILTVNAQ